MNMKNRMVVIFGYQTLENVLINDYIWISQHMLDIKTLISLTCPINKVLWYSIQLYIQSLQNNQCVFPFFDTFEKNPYFNVILIQKKFVDIKFKFTPNRYTTK